MIKIVRLYLSFFEATLRLQKLHILMNGWNRLPVMVAATYSLKAFYFPGQSVFDCISSLFPPAPIIYSHESGRASEARQGETGGRGFALWHSALVFQKGTMQSPLQSLRRGGGGHIIEKLTVSPGFTAGLHRSGAQRLWEPVAGADRQHLWVHRHAGPPHHRQLPARLAVQVQLQLPPRVSGQQHSAGLVSYTNMNNTLRVSTEILNVTFCL